MNHKEINVLMMSLRVTSRTSFGSVNVKTTETASQLGLTNM